MLIPIGAEPYQLPSEVESLRSDINAKIAQLASDKAALEGEAGALRNLDPGAFTAADVQRAQAHGPKRLALIQREIVIRRRLRDEWWPSVSQARGVALDKAGAARMNAEAAVRAKLVSIGFIDGPVRDLETPGIAPGTISRHPSVSDAAGREATLFGLYHQHEGAIQNDQALARLEGELQLAVRRLTAPQ